MAKGHKQTQTYRPDASTQAMQDATYGAAQKAASGYSVAGPDQNTLAALGLFGNLAGYGNTGAAALAGDQTATNSLMNPYLNDVVGGVNAQYGQDQQAVRKNINDAATQAGAFGGDRAALEQGAAQAQLGLGHQQQIADLLHGGYNEMLARAAGLANLGMGAAGAQFQGGDYLRNIAQEQANPDVVRAQILAAGRQGGYAGGGSQTNYTKTGAAQNILGAASTIGGLFGGVPGLSGLGSIFGGAGALFPSSFGAGLFGNATGSGLMPPTPGGGTPTGFAMPNPTLNPATLSVYRQNGIFGTH